VTIIVRRPAPPHAGLARAIAPGAVAGGGAIVGQVIGPVHIILYVRDQGAATAFWRAVLDCRPALDVAGMTEFALGAQVVLGLMPETGIRSLLGPPLPDPAGAHGIPRAEIYLVVDDAAGYHARALAAGGTELSALAPRSWGDSAAYSLDPDGHVVAFATRPPHTGPGPRGVLSLEQSYGHRHSSGLCMTTTFEAQHAARPPATLGSMASVRAVLPAARLRNQPGRRAVLVAASLADLHGPKHGPVELPLWLFWYPDRTFDLDEPGMLAWLYQIVLREARRPEDLGYLNGERLAAVWPDLQLPSEVRQAWEEQHPVLRDAAVPAAT